MIIVNSTDEAKVKQVAEQRAGERLEKGDGYCLVARRAHYTLKAGSRTIFSVIMHLGAGFTELREPGS